MSQKSPKLKKSKKITKKKKFNASSHVTSASVIIDTHYASLKIQDRWTRSRVERLCGYLRITQAELASVVGVRHSNFNAYIKRARVPMPIGLLLTLLESHYLKGMAPDIIEGLFNYGRS